LCGRARRGRRKSKILKDKISDFPPPSASYRRTTRLTKCAGGPPNFIKKVSRLPSPHAWGRPMLIGLAVFALWLVISVATYQESPEDTPIIVSLLSK
jgi:hypothetical protein